MHTILSETTILNDSLIIQQADIQDPQGNTFRKLRINRENAAAVLLYDTDTKAFILTRQFRYPVADRTGKLLLEVVAGKLDKGEEPLQAAIREVEEEAGYRLKPEQVQLLTGAFASPGYSSEYFYIYLATVTATDKVSPGGGLAEENEQIETVRIDRDAFWKMIADGSINDIKTLVAGLLAKNVLPSL
jgi:nudix-type nucleoside diphosphatase (YffH/AdpP family)